MRPSRTARPDAGSQNASPPWVRTLIRFHSPTYQQTRAEVTRCTREGITINTFMLEDSPGLMHFVHQITQINKGRAFYATPDRLGEYILVDYVNQKQKRVG